MHLVYLASCPEPPPSPVPFLNPCTSVHGLLWLVLVLRPRHADMHRQHAACAGDKCTENQSNISTAFGIVDGSGPGTDSPPACPRHATQGKLKPRQLHTCMHRRKAKPMQDLFPWVCLSP
eukprot:gb/GFBE01045865.1/.p2 GENE.gb/GFBE01045865.1/~~gb/GFBE01045865.1/.p2  ORF type:complete len:120 (-),score=1.89 gb/GFBE01045865.1/:46-405(-)